METARRKIREILEGAKNPVVMWSGQKDSTLLLFLVREINPDISILWFNQSANKELQAWAEKIIQEWDLTVFSHAPADRYFLPNEQGLTLVDEYSFAGVRLPLLTDTVDADRCALKLSRQRTPEFYYEWPETLLGTKDADRHFILGKGYFPGNGFQFGSTKLYAPLRHLTDTAVLQAVNDLKVPYCEIDDRLPVCTKCLQGGRVYCPDAQQEIECFTWNPAERLHDFRLRFLPASSEVFASAD